MAAGFADVLALCGVWLGGKKAVVAAAAEELSEPGGGRVGDSVLERGRGVRGRGRPDVLPPRGDPHYERMVREAVRAAVAEMAPSATAALSDAGVAESPTPKEVDAALYRLVGGDDPILVAIAKDSEARRIAAEELARLDRRSVQKFLIPAPSPVLDDEDEIALILAML